MSSRALALLAATLLGLAVVGTSGPSLAAPKTKRAKALKSKRKVTRARKTKTLSLCADGAERYFSCSTEDRKLISLCRAAGEGVEYRFGTAEKIELSYPGVQRDPPLRYAHYSRAMTDYVQVTFRSGGADYAVFDNEEAGKREAGVHARLASGREISIVCKGTIAGRLGALEDVLPCDADNALNLGSCPSAAN
jgi:hypothetical protein